MAATARRYVWYVSFSEGQGPRICKKGWGEGGVGEGESRE